MNDLVEEVVPLRGRDLRILRPRDSEALLSEEAFEQEEYLPYWAELWPSALGLARAVARRPLTGRRAIELGCGLGLPAIAAAVAGARVLATDWSPDAVAMTSRDAERNGVQLETRLFRWDAAPEPMGPPWQLVLASDVLYEARNVAPLLALLPRLTAAAGEIWLADPGRAPAAGFLDAAAGYRLTEYFKSLANLDAAAFDYLNVAYLVAAPGRQSPGPRWRPVYSGADGTVFRNLSALPRVFSPERIESAPTAQAASSPRRTDWRERGLVAASEWRGSASPALGANGKAVVSRYGESANSVRFHASVAGGAPSVLTTSLVDDGGWTARGGVSLGRANGPFLALSLPPGEHDVDLRYAAPGFRAGAAVSLVTLVALAILVAVRRRRHA